MLYCIVLHCTALSSHPQGEHCEGIFSGFALNVVISGTAVKFEPDPSGFEVSEWHQQL